MKRKIANDYQENIDNLSNIYRLGENLKNIEFSIPDLISATTQYKVEALDKSNTSDMMVFAKIIETAKQFVAHRQRTKSRFEGNRSNDVGKQIEEAFFEELKKTSLGVKLLGEAGYPDMKIIGPDNRVTYLESKAVSKDWDSSFRSFYYSNGKKIESDGRHLLIAWKIEETRDKIWSVTGWKLLDLANLKVKIKLEFNTSNKKMYTESSILSSSG